MENQHSISNEAINNIQTALTNNRCWLAYNEIPYHLGPGDVFSFKYKEEAQEFASNNISEYDCFNVIHASSVEEVCRKLHTDLPKNAISISSLLNNTNMNQKNFEYLRDQVKFTGFGEGLENELKEKVQKQTTDFTLSHQTKFGNETVDATLNFKKSSQSDMYFFNAYNVNLSKENSAENMQQTFYINKGNNITLKEAYNLMNGRAVNKDLTNKEGQLYNAWVQMDFKQTDTNGNYKLKQFHQNYGFDLNKELAKHPIKELGNDEDKNRLVSSLEKGNRQSATFLRDGGEQKQFIEANPQFKTINIYDSNMQRLGNKQSKDEKQAQGEGNTIKQDAKKESQSNDDAGPDIPTATKKRAKKQGQSVG